jgi:hypothetical protein
MTSEKAVALYVARRSYSLDAYGLRKPTLPGRYGEFAKIGYSSEGNDAVARNGLSGGSGTILYEAEASKQVSPKIN